MNKYNDYKNYNDYKGYKDLPFFKQAEIVYDFTTVFCARYVTGYTRTKDQMVQAARSGKQNIAEGYLQKSTESKLKLLNVARGSLEELLNDYGDFLRQHRLPIWEKNSPSARAVRRLVYNRYNCYNDYKSYTKSPETAANAMLTLINQTNQLLDQKIRWLTEKFVKEGGFREGLLKKRLAYRKQNNDYNGYNRYKNYTKSLGFTLIELIVVISIIGVLSSLIINNLNDARARARDTKRKQELSSLKTALRLYYNDYQTYPAAPAGNDDILGCGANGTTACGGTGADFSTTGTVYMKQLPEFSYYSQDDNGDGFTLKTTLENLSDQDLTLSQSRCPNGVYEDTDYVICED